MMSCTQPCQAIPIAASSFVLNESSTWIKVELFVLMEAREIIVIRFHGFHLSIKNVISHAEYFFSIGTWQSSFLQSARDDNDFICSLFRSGGQ